MPARNKARNKDHPVALLRHPAHAALMAALIAGCSQSLFDDVTGGGNNGGADGSVTRPDARPGNPDGGPEPVPDGGRPGEPDGGNDGPDASVPTSCPPPCVGDAFEEFSDTQGGTNERWRYIEVQPEALPGAQYVDMDPYTFAGAVPGWRGVGTPPPSIARCVEVQQAPPCLEFQGLVALTTSSGPDAHRPALLWTPSEYGAYIVSGSWRGSTQGEGVAAALTFALNSEDDVLRIEETTLTTTPKPFDFMVLNVVLGDDLVVSASTDSGESVSIGVDLFISGPY